MPATISPPLSKRFTVDGSETLENRLCSICAEVERGVRKVVPASRLDGLLLAGGYGRGEGGVLRTSAGDEPYNDLEFYVFVRGNAILAEREFREPLHQLGHAMSVEAGLEVEFKVLTLEKLEKALPSMFYYDLSAAHRWVLGDDRLLSQCEHHLDASAIPLHEATRLLMNRCSGLLFSAERLQRNIFSPVEADFVARNLAKAQLAFGDVLLTAHGQYHWSSRERHDRLKRLKLPQGLPGPELLRHHATGLEFKLHPVRCLESRETLAPRHEQLKRVAGQIWLWLESRRLNLNFSSLSDYACTNLNLCPETASLRNWLLNVRILGPAGFKCFRYPRERLLRSLVLLLWDSNQAHKVQAELRAESAGFGELVAAYEKLWRRFN